MKKHVIVSRREGDYDFYSLRKDPLMAWVPADHPRVRDGVYPLRDFETEPYIDTYPGQETDNNLAFRAHGLTPRGQFLSIDVKSTKAMVAAGLGVSLNNAILAHEMKASSGAWGFLRMPFGCPARGENGAFESNNYYGNASFHSN